MGEDAPASTWLAFATEIRISEPQKLPDYGECENRAGLNSLKKQSPLLPIQRIDII